MTFQAGFCGEPLRWNWGVQGTGGAKEGDRSTGSQGAPSFFRTQCLPTHTPALGSPSAPFSFMAPGHIVPELIIYLVPVSTHSPEFLGPEKHVFVGSFPKAYARGLLRTLVRGEAVTVQRLGSLSFHFPVRAGRPLLARPHPLPPSTSAMQSGSQAVSEVLTQASFLAMAIGT